MKIKWFSRVFAVVMVVTMLMLSCLSAVALTPTASDISTADDRAYSFAFEDGVLTLRINPDKVYNMIKDGDVSREELREFIPEDILAAMEQNTLLTLDDLRAIAAEYITVEDLRALIDQLPTDIVREYFSLDMITELDILDDMLDILPIADMLEAVDADAIRSVVSDEVMELILANEHFEDEFVDAVLTPEAIESLVSGDDPLLTKDVAANVFKGKLDSLVTDSVVEGLLADEAFLNRVFADTELIDDILTDSVMGQIADGRYFDNLISPEEVLDSIILDEALTALGISTGQIFDDCVDPADHQAIYDAYGADFTAQELLDGGFITLDGVIAKYDITARKLIERDVVETQDIRDLVGDGEIKGVLLGSAEVRAILKSSLDGNANVDVNDYWKHVDIKKVVELVGEENIATMVAGDTELLDRLITQIDPMDILEAIGIDVFDVIESAGGPGTVFSFFTPAEIKAIISAIDKNALASFIKNDLLESVDIKAIARDVVDFVRENSADFKAFAKELIEHSTTMLTAEVDYISINGINFYEREYAMFDLNALLEAIIAALPDFDTFTQLGADAIVASFDAEISVRGSVFELGVELGYLGDPTNLNKFIKSKAHLFKLDIADDNSITIQTNTPNVLSEIYRELLEADSLSVDIRNKLASIPLESLEDAILMLQELSDEERQAIVDALDGKLEAIRDAAYAEIEAEYENTPVLYSLRRVFLNSTNDETDPAMQASLDQVDSIINAFTSAEKLETAISGMDTVLEFAASDQLKGSALVDLYNSNGNFTAGSAISFDVLELANKVVTVPEELQLFLMSTEVSVGAAYDATVDGLFGVEVLVEDGSTFKTILPAGVDVSKLQDIPVLEGFAQGLIDADLNSLLYMPEGDMKAYSAGLYTVQFIANGTVLDTIFYTYGEDTVDVPEIPDEYERVGYTVDWESFSLNQIQRLTVELEYTAIKYDATFVSYNRTDVVKFTIEDIEDGQFKNPAMIPAVGEKLGYTGVWEEYTLELADITINAEYTINVYTAKFVSHNRTNTVSFTIEDIENGRFKDASKQPAVADKIGYTGVWEDYTLGASDITINAVYTADVYTATFISFGRTDIVTFTVEDIENGRFKDATKQPAVADRLGYTGVWEAYSLGLNNITINAVYTADVYTATFVSYNKTDTVNFTIEDIENGQFKDATKVPAVGAKQGYTGVWKSYTLGLSNITIEAEYTINTYTATFVSHNKTDIVTFTINDIENGQFKDATKVPTVGEKIGYRGAWKAYTLGLSDITVEAEYTAIVYTATFESYNKTDRVGFTVEDVVNGKPKPDMVPTIGAKIGYTGAWKNYTIDVNNPGPITVEAEYTAIDYTATFISHNKTDRVSFTVEDVVNGKLKADKVPDVGVWIGYEGVWKDYTIDVNNPGPITVEAEYTAIVYVATFKSFGKTDSVNFTVEDVVDGKLKADMVPTVGEKVGYTGAWENYTINVNDPDDITINAIYSVITYTATFMVDGEVWATVTFTVEDTSITEPAVPEKEGYTGAWEPYELTASDIIINAVYTAIGTDTTTDVTDSTGKPGSKDDDEEEVTKGPVADLVDDLVEEGTFWWWILLIIAIIVIIAIVLFIILGPKDDDDDGDDTPPEAPVVEEVVDETPETTVPTVDAVDVADADALMADDVALATVVYKVGGSTEGYKATVNLGAINDAFADGDKVNIETLKAKGLVPAKTKRVKILASGRLDKHALEVEANSFSLQAIKMITLTGGTAVQKK